MTNFTSIILELANRRKLKETNIASQRNSAYALKKEIAQHESWIAEDEAEVANINRAIELLEAAHRVGQ